MYQRKCHKSKIRPTWCVFLWAYRPAVLKGLNDLPKVTHRLGAAWSLGLYLT